MRVLHSIAFAVTISASATPALAQLPPGDADGGVFSSTILGIPISPRAVALGEAMGAISGDPAAIWYNAAGLAGLRTNAFTVNASQRFAQTQLVGAAVAFPTEIGSFGIAARGFNAGTITPTSGGDQVGGAQRAYQLVLEGGGALQLSKFWRWGGSLYYSQETLAQNTQSSIGVNSGMQFPDIFGRLTLDGGVRNLGTKVSFDETSKGFTNPQLAYFGGGYDFFRRRNLIQTPLLFRGQPIVVDAKAVAQLNAPWKEQVYGGFGLEGTANGVLLARIGYQTGDNNRKGLSLGAGINVGQFRLEYAFRNYQNGGAKFFENDPVGDSHNVSFTYFWGERETNAPTVPLIVTQPVDTAAINNAVRDAISKQIDALRPLLDSLRQNNVQIQNTGDLTARYVVPVHFGFDSTAVRDSDLVVLGQIADVIRRIYPSALVTIEGFADPAGTPQYNSALSRRRAEAVRDVMVSRFNMPAQQFKTVGYGDQRNRQVTPGAERDAAGAEQNRRVTFTIDATQHF